MIKGEKSRKTLVQLQSECGVKDPAHQAKLAVSELDKTAKNSQAKRKKCIDQIDSDQHEIDHIDHQIAQIKERYDPLCAGLKEKEEQKKMMIKVLERCVADNHTIMGDIKVTVNTSMLDESKLVRKMASMQLEMSRGFNTRPDSTFHMPSINTKKGSQTFGLTGGTKIPALPSASKRLSNLASTA